MKIYTQKATCCIFSKISHGLLFFHTSEIIFLCTFWYFLLHLGQSIFLVHSLILFYLILESAYSQTLLYFHRNTVHVVFQLIVRKILVLSNPPRMTTSIFQAKFVFWTFSTMQLRCCNVEKKCQETHFSGFFHQCSCIIGLEEVVTKVF